MNDQGLDIPLIIMTGYADIQSAVLAMKLGARDYIAKPVNPEELLKKSVMKKITLILLTISFCGLTACKTGTKKGGDMDKETLVKIETTARDIKVKLYNETE